MVCIRCQKRPAIIFIQRMVDGQMKQEGYCLHCARELHIKPVDDLMKQFGMSDQDLDNMENRMESMMEELGDSNPLSMMMNMTQGGEDAPDEDEDLIPGSNATFPLGFTSSEKQDGDKKGSDRKNGKKPPKRKFLDTYCALGEHVWSLILPAFTQSLGISALLIRNMQNEVAQIFTIDYVDFARSKGLAPMRVRVWYILRNVMISTTTLFSIGIASMLGGSVIIETVFSLPGLGSLIMSSILARDYPAVQGCVILFAVIIMAVNLLTDILYSVLDPRVKLQ